MEAAKRRTLIAIAIPLIMVGIDATILIVALPTIARDLDTSSSELVWINSAYIIVFGSTILLSASLGDKFGRRRVLQIGMAVFILGSALSGISDTLNSATFLIFARAIQGLGAGAIPPSTLSLIRSTFSDERERARAIGIWAGLSGIGLAAGPILGGLILTSTSAWGWIFYINVPIVILGGAMIHRYTAESRDSAAAPIDTPGALLSLSGLLALFYGLIEGPVRGWDSAPVLVSFALAAVLLVWFVLYELRKRFPELDPRLFKSAAFTSGVLSITVAFLALMGLIYELTLYLQTVRGFSPLRAGVSLLPFAVALLIVAPLAPKLAERHGDRLTVMFGMAALAAGLLAFLATSTSSSYLVVFAGLVLAGIGVSLIQPPASAAMMSSVSAAKAGMASGTNAAIRQIGASFGIAVMGGIGQSIFSHDLTGSRIYAKLPGEAQSVAEASISGAVAVGEKIGGAPGEELIEVASNGFISGMHWAVLVAAAFAGLGLVIAARLIPQRAEASAEHRRPAGG
ncbi:MAG: MFS transporter [Solirubrobacterales bacterium]|nr:MFS transporter [Solirubrobacterales bacterium]